ncbi:MAG: UDP-glucose/GDP-mannose dehydrogenase family protein [Dehalococcoidia bacterium]
MERRIAVAGAGHVGLVTAACFAELGHRVTCVEIDRGRIEGLRRGELPFFEPGLGELVERHTVSGRLTFTTDYAEGAGDADFVFIAVATPITPDGTPDLRHVRSAAREVVRVAGERHPIIVSKSTAPVGISETLEHMLALEGNGAGPLPLVANPEFLREGTAVRDFLEPDRVVLGSDDTDARDEVASLYEPLGCPVVLTDIKTAEMVKYASNAFLATKISFINEIAAVCERVGADVRDVARGMGLDPRIGPDFLSAGLGFGGSCLPKDVKALAHLAAVYGSHPQLLHAVLQINADQKRKLIARLRDVLGTLRGRTVVLLGLAFKPGTDDVRDAPSLDLIHSLQYEEVDLRACDPVAVDGARALFPDVHYETDPYIAATDADAVILVTEWPEYRQLDLGRLRDVMRTPVLADGRNALDPEEARRQGFVYLGIGLADESRAANGHRVLV